MSAVAMILAVRQLIVWDVRERVWLSLFPGGTVVPLSDISAERPVADGSKPLIVSTSMAVVQDQATSAAHYCHEPPPRLDKGVLARPAATTWVAADRDHPTVLRRVHAVRHSACRRARLNPRDQVIVRCYVGTRGVMYAQATYLLFGAPLDRVPRSRLTVTIADDHAQPATESVDLS